ncbi:MAG TPA: hypothetical protein VK155_04825 [Bacteroidales bacterium]|jgi:ABC-type maltose transport system permease subunit|nr:hypothetical protein [Bacteroidales bacterium]
MNASEIRKLLTGLADQGSDAEKNAEKLQEQLDYDFSNGFTGRILNSIFSARLAYTREIEFSRSLSLAFSRIAITGIAAIVLLLISIFMMQGSLSFDSILGLSDSQTESILCLLTGN